MTFRTGIGYDLHRLVEGRPLVLGGVRIPYARGLLGHSDADVVLHALAGALLGAAGMGDLGDLFPDTDPQYQDADSRQLLAKVLERVRSAGYLPENAVVVIHAQQPKLGSHKAQIKRALAEQLGLAPESVGVQATTNEGLDAIGRGEAIACWASVLLRRD